MISAEMKKLADAIRENGEAIRVFREQYIPALRSTHPAASGQPRDATPSSGTGIVSSPADHAQLIQGIMDNMDTIQTLASASGNRTALPVSGDCDIDFDVRKCSILEDLNELPQTRFLSAVRSQSESVDSLVRNTSEAEKTLRMCS